MGDEATRNAVFKQLYEQGLRPTDLEIQDDDGISKKLVWPGILVSYRGKTIPIDLLKNQIGSGSEEMLNSSIEALEFEFSNTIQKLVSNRKPRIAFIEGQGELDKYQTADIMRSLADYYAVDRKRLDQNINVLTNREALLEDSSTIVVRNNYDVIVIAKPDSAFNDRNKFIIDQYLMYGGKILWLIDPLHAEMDSLTKSDMTLGIARDLNLNDLLFSYGVRINDNLIQDLQSAPIPLPVGMVGDQPRYELFPWYYFPLFSSTSNHPIVNNINLVMGEFTSTIDFVGKDDLKKTVLLTSSEYTKVLNTPVRISLGITKFDPKVEQFNKSYSPVAVLVEGEFTSLYDGALAPEFQQSKEVKFKSKSENTKMIVVSDGDIIKNHVRAGNRIVPLGIDRYTKREYGNKEFILNAINYLSDESGLINARSRSIKLRLLDVQKVEREQLYWQLINMLIPLLFIAILGIAHYFIRNKVYR